MMNNTEVVAISIRNWISWLWVDRYYTLWFLQNLIIFILLTPTIWLFLKNHFKKIPTGLIALIILLVAIMKYGSDNSYVSGLDVYLVGSYIGLNCRDIIPRRNRIVSFSALIYIGSMFVISFGFWNIFTKILFCIAIWYAMDLLNFTNIRITWWMKITFFTYVAHDMLLEALEKIFLKVFGINSLLALLDYIFVPLLVEFVLIVIAYFMQKKVPMIWKVITGGR